MNPFLVGAICLLIGGVSGYGFRGWIHRKIQFVNDRYARVVVDVRNAYKRLESAATKGEADLRAEVQKLLADLKKYVPNVG